MWLTRRAAARLLGVGAAAGALAGAGGGVAAGMVIEQAKRARRRILVAGWAPERADGIYRPDGTGPLPVARDRDAPPLTLVMMGDSSAAGLGADEAHQLPGVLLARGLADEAHRPVRLVTVAVVGSTARALGGQVESAIAEQPDAVLVMIGANDVTNRVPPVLAASLLGEAVCRLRAAGAAVVVGTCPDLGVVRAIPQPLRAVVSVWSRTLARRQRDAVLRSGGVAVPLADLLAPDFGTSAADRLFSGRDRYHPSATGYDAACSVLLPALCSALGVWDRRVLAWSASHRRRRGGSRRRGRT